MEIIGQLKLWSFISGCAQAREVDNHTVCTDPGYGVSDYLDLVRKIAELQFRNRDFILLFRGQDRDYHDLERKKTALKPSLFRSNDPEIRLSEDALVRRFKKLRRAEKELVRLFPNDGVFLGREYIERSRVLRWAILQHYDVCPTPLLDVSQSLRIAASFASPSADGEAFLYAIGLPHLSGAITASAEAGLQTVRLSSVCPPSAVRPHIQEGYLIGEYPEMDDFEQKQFYHSYEIDFGRRLIAKFRFNPTQFWHDSRDFPKVPLDALYPNADDPLYRLARQLKSIIDADPELQEGVDQPSALGSAGSLGTGAVADAPGTTEDPLQVAQDDDFSEDDPPTGTKKKKQRGYELNGVFVPCNNAISVVVGMLKSLAAKEPGFAERCHAHPWNKGNLRTYIAPNRAELYPNRPDFQNRSVEFAKGWFVATHESNERKARIIRMALNVAGLTENVDARFCL